MSRLFRFEEFDVPARQQPETQTSAPAVSPEQVEEARLTGYEAGYQAGWDDAAKNDDEDRNRISAEFARNLQDLGFTFHEARSHVMQSLEPLLASMVEKVLPKLISDTIGQAIVEELLPLAAEAADTPIQVLVYPQGCETLEELLSQNNTIPIELVAEASLAEGQVYIRMGQIEKQIDLSGAVHRIGEAISGLYEINERAQNHG